MGLTIVLSCVVAVVVVMPISSSIAHSHRHSQAQSEGVKRCIPKKFSGSESFVCVCNSTYCDTVSSYNPLTSTDFTVFSSSSASDRLAKHVYNISEQSNITDHGLKFTVDASLRYQTVLGFGGAFTDAAGMNFFNLSVGAQDLLIKSYYSSNGIEYTIGRIPMASCDFSTHPYSYDDNNGDFSLENFSLAKEDLQFKIPMIKSALEHSSRPVKLFGSPWSAPAWMKTNGHMNGKGQLIGQPGGKYFKTWAQYFVRFVEEYKKKNLTLWGLTVQNEPIDGAIKNFSFQAMHFTAEMERDFIKVDLGPALESSGLQPIHLMMLDGQSFHLPTWPQIVLGDPEAKRYVSGIGVHWYIDKYTPYELKLSETHQLFPDQFLLYTEACYDSTFSSKSVDLGSWSRGEGYSKSIITVMNNWVTGWVDWNLALNMEGGPNWAQNYVDSPILVNASNDEFYKQPMYYHLGHFSKFIVPGSVRIGTSRQETGDIKTDSVYSVAFSLPDGSRTFVILNMANEEYPISIHDPSVGFINGVLPPRAIQTYIWKPS
nr:lysosomal acid glucosylceramidase-like [Lytechinus pictus]